MKLITLLVGMLAVLSPAMAKLPPPLDRFYEEPEPGDLTFATTNAPFTRYVVVGRFGNADKVFDYDIGTPCGGATTVRQFMINTKTGQDIAISGMTPNWSGTMVEGGVQITSFYMVFRKKNVSDHYFERETMNFPECPLLICKKYSDTMYMWDYAKYFVPFLPLTDFTDTLFYRVGPRKPNQVIVIK